MAENSKLIEEFLKRLEEKGLRIDENGKISRKGVLPLLHLWVQNNFLVVYSFGDCTIGSTAAEEKQTKKIFKSCHEIEKLSQDKRKLFFFAFSSLIHNLKIHLHRLQNQKGQKKGYILSEIIMGDEMDPIAELAMTNPEIKYDWNKNPIVEKKIEIFKGSHSKKSPKITGDDDPIFKEAAKVLSKKINKVNGATKGIPEFVNSLSFQIDYWLKKIMPGIKTNAIIRDVLSYLDLEQYCYNIKQIDNYIKRGKKLLSK
jgi:hypothetical protein